MPDALEHITLATGDTRLSLRSEVPPDIVDILRPLVLTGLAEIPSKPGFLLRVTRAGTAAMFDVERDHTPSAPWPHGRSPIVTCGLACTADDAHQVWSLLEQLHQRLYPTRGHSTRRTPQPWRHQPLRQPARPPWLAVVLLPGLALLKPHDVSWLADLERCVAWTLLSLDSTG